MSKPIQRSFAAGEITEELFARVDLAKRQTGLALAKNFWTLPHGPAQNRPGTRYVLDVKDSTNKVRLRGFSYSDTQTMVLEFGAGWLRFHTAGGTLLEATTAITGITQANPGVVTDNAHGYPNGQTVFLTGIGGMTQLNGRFVKVAGAAANTFQLQDLQGNNINTTGYGAYTAGGTAARVYEIATTYAAADIFDLHFTQKADVMTITHPSYDPMELKRLGATNWTLTAPTFQSGIAVPNMPTVMNGTTLDQSANNSNVNLGIAITVPTQIYHYVVTAVDKTTGEESPAITELVGTGNPGGAQISTMFNANAATNANPAIFTAPFVPGTPNTEFMWVTGNAGAWAVLNGKKWGFTSVGGQTFKLFDPATGVYFDSTALGAYPGGMTAGMLGLLSNLNAAGQFHDIRATGAANTRYFNVYKKLNGIYGYIGQLGTGTLDYLRDNNITPDMSRTLAINDGNPFAAAGDKPGAVGYYEGRRIFGGMNNNPLFLIASRAGTEANMTYSIPSRDDDAIRLSILSSEAQRIRHIMPLDTLILLTAMGEWKVAPVNSDILTPASAKPKMVSAEGANNVQPVIAGSAVLFAAAQGGRIRELKYKADANFIAAYNTTDISVMAPHLFDGFTILDMAYTRTPNKMAWFVRSDGALIGLTYLPEQDVYAWHQHATDGLFESVAAVLEGNEAVLYCIVNRNGVRKVEQFSTRRFAVAADYFFVDSGATYSGAPITTIQNGLWHLEGKVVSILADGAVHAQRTVTGGAITLDQPASKVQIGLPITADLQTLPVAVEGAPAFGMANVKNVNEAWIRVKETSNLKVGPDFATMRVAKQRTNEPWGSPPGAKSGVVQITLDGKWVDDGAICIRQDQPLPVTISSIALGVRDGG
jgi:hypothetical protein